MLSKLSTDCCVGVNHVSNKMLIECWSSINCALIMVKCLLRHLLNVDQGAVKGID